MRDLPLGRCEIFTPSVLGAVSSPWLACLGEAPAALTIAEAVPRADTDPRVLHLDSGRLAAPLVVREDPADARETQGGAHPPSDVEATIPVPAHM